MYVILTEVIIAYGCPKLHSHHLGEMLGSLSPGMTSPPFAGLYYGGHTDISKRQQAQLALPFAARFHRWPSLENFRFRSVRQVPP